MNSPQLRTIFQEKKLFFHEGDATLQRLGPPNHGTLFPFQVQALRQSQLLTGSPTLCIAPPGAGKSLIADAAIAAALSRNHGMVVYLVPTRALARERAQQLAQTFAPSGHRVLCGIGENGNPDEDLISGRADVAVVVYEKARRLFMRGCWPMPTSLVVADEFQITLDPERGPTAMQLLQTWQRQQPGLPLLALTCCTAGIEEPAKNLYLEIIRSGERPEPLRQGVIDPKRGTASWTCSSSGQQGSIDLPVSTKLLQETDPETALAEMIAPLEKPVLIFAATRRQAARLAQRLSERMPLNEEKAAALRKKAPHDPLLPDLMGRSIGLHSADLAQEQRHLVEQWLTQGKLDYCVATTTLAEGINTGAKTVVVLPEVETLAGPLLENLLGRAGRPGSGPGYAFTITPLNERPAFFNKTPQTLNPRKQTQLLMELIAFELLRSHRQDEITLYERLETLGFTDDAIHLALDQGMQNGFWTKEGDEQVCELVINTLAEILAFSGAEAEVLAGWRTMLRRFRDGGGPAAMAFLALGGSSNCDQIPLSRDERLCGRYPSELIELLSSDNSPLARYFSDFLKNSRQLPRRLHQAAKGAVLFVQTRQGKSVWDLGREYEITAGQAEDCLKKMKRLLSMVGELCRMMSLDQVKLPDLKTPPAPTDHHTPLTEAPEITESKLIIYRGSTGLIRLNGIDIYLTKLQFRLLDLLARQAGRGVPYERVEDYVWPDAKVERQQISFHRKNLEDRLRNAGALNGYTLIETHTTWGLRLTLDKSEIQFEEDSSTLLNRLGDREDEPLIKIEV